MIGPLLAAPPARGELQQALQELAGREYRNPVSGQPIALGVSTIERWYYRARLSPDPVGALRNQVRSDAGGHPSVSAAQRVVLRQHREHPGWSYQLHYDNLKVLAEQQPELGRVPSYAVVRRWMKTQGLYRRKRTRVRHTAAARRAACRLEQREVRSVKIGWNVDTFIVARSRCDSNLRADLGRSGLSSRCSCRAGYQGYLRSRLSAERSCVRACRTAGLSFMPL